ncbi:MAG: histidine kinase N-terminal domain-containing protein [Chloroflexi bacterium]|nr:histidine kinase N-terminal domain-containing protein [Chloroflexota bacterium]
MDSAVRVQPTTKDGDSAYLDRIGRVIPLLADLSRADILICVPRGDERAQVVAQAKPHSIAPVHRAAMIGEMLTRENAGALFRAMAERQYTRSQREYPHQGSSEGAPAPVVQEAYPVEAPTGQIVGGVLIETNLLESERLRRRSEVFQRVLKALQQMALRGEPQGIGELSAFGEHDGVIVTDSDRIIRYMSGIAVNLYRNIGYGEPLVGKPLSYLETQDDEFVRQALERRACLQVELDEHGRNWIKKAIPISRAERASLFAPAREHLIGTFLLVHDDTEARQRARELLIKTTMIKEMHHRVKNDLQTVASLLRMQARRMQTTEAKGALGEAVNRILSIAVIHEFLSEQDTRVINIREVAQRIIQQMEQGVLDPERRIAMKLAGPNVFLSARQATSCALVINELLQNALEHGFDPRAAGGTISLTFHDHGDAIGLVVHDDGHDLPPNFNLQNVDSLGLRIVRMLVTEDLKGQIELQSDRGVSAIVRFPKIPLGGEEWNEPE